MDLNDEKLYSGIMVLLCMFAISIILNIGLLTKHIIINKGCECDCGGMKQCQESQK